MYVKYVTSPAIAQTRKPNINPTLSQRRLFSDYQQLSSVRDVSPYSVITADKLDVGIQMDDVH